MSTPDFNYAAFYYPEILAALLDLKRRLWPEHTEEDPHDPVVQLYRAFAMVGHSQAVRLDHAARELYLPTLRLRPSLVAVASLIDYDLAPPTPAEAEIVGTLGGSLTTTTTIVRAHSHFSTRDRSPVVFEYKEDSDLQVGATGAWTVVEDDNGTFTTVTTFPRSLWGGTPVAGEDTLYLGHAGAMFSKVGLDLSVAGADLSIVRWEYYDDLISGQPDTVSAFGPGIRFEVDGVVGSTRSDGLSVTVTCLRTGGQETVTTTWSGSANRITTAGTLGQLVVSTNPGDYKVETNWPELPDLVADDLETADEREITWSLPQTTTRRWAKTTINSVEGYWIRARVITVGGAPSSPTLDGATEPRKTEWSVLIEVSQGQRVEDKLGTTDTGTADQTFELNRSPFMELVSVTVDGTEWTRVDNFLSSNSYDRHYTLTEDPDGTRRVTFGDGDAGRIPDSTVQVIATYRIGGDVSGNVGADTITRDRTGNAKVKAWSNPRAASGWVELEGSTDASLARARVAAPASLRALGRGVTPEDMETLSVAFRTDDGSQVAERALAVEEGNGPKTIALVAAGPGGIAPVAADLAELDEYFNGTTKGLQRIGGVLLANQELTGEAFTPETVDITVTVDVLEAYATGAQAAIETTLGAILGPVAKRLVLNSDGEWEAGTDYLWEWGGTVARAILFAYIATSVSGVVNVTLTSPAADVSLGSKALPVAGTISVTVNTV